MHILKKFINLLIENSILKLSNYESIAGLESNELYVSYVTYYMDELLAVRTTVEKHRDKIKRIQKDREIGEIIIKYDNSIVISKDPTEYYEYVDDKFDGTEHASIIKFIIGNFMNVDMEDNLDDILYMNTLNSNNDYALTIRKYSGKIENIHSLLKYVPHANNIYTLEFLDNRYMTPEHSENTLFTLRSKGSYI